MGTGHKDSITKLPLKMEDDERQSIAVRLWKIRNERMNLILHIGLFPHIGDSNKLIPQTVRHQRLLRNWKFS